MTAERLEPGTVVRCPPETPDAGPDHARPCRSAASRPRGAVCTGEGIAPNVVRGSATRGRRPWRSGWIVVSHLRAQTHGRFVVRLPDTRRHTLHIDRARDRMADRIRERGAPWPCATVGSSTYPLLLCQIMPMPKTRSRRPRACEPVRVRRHFMAGKRPEIRQSRRRRPSPGVSRRCTGTWLSPSRSLRRKSPLNGCIRHRKCRPEAAGAGSKAGANVSPRRGRA